MARLHGRVRSWRPRDRRFLRASYELPGDFLRRPAQGTLYRRSGAPPGQRPRVPATGGTESGRASSRPRSPRSSRSARTACERFPRIGKTTAALRRSSITASFSHATRDRLPAAEAAAQNGLSRSLLFGPLSRRVRPARAVIAKAGEVVEPAACPRAKLLLRSRRRTRIPG